MKTTPVHVSIAILLMTFLYSSSSLFGSGLFSESPVFTYTTHPDLPLKKFVQGELGVLQSSYEGPALYVAYRHLIGMGFDAEEQKAILGLWNRERGLPSIVREQETVPEPDPIKVWYNTRSRVPGVNALSPVEEVYRLVHPDSYFSYLNCHYDAFRTATQTLVQRIDQFGAKSLEVKDWLQAQDQVFANCAGGQTIPAAAAPGLHPLIQADRAYQIAAAHFYTGNFDIARQMFEDIAKDPSSPWRPLASYLVARTLLRKATVDAGPGKTDWETFAQAEVQLQEVLKDSSLSAVHPAARRLLNFVRASLHPAERMQELVHAILQPHSGATLGQDLSDYMVLPLRASRIRTQQAGCSNKDELADWASTLRNGDEGFRDAWKKWQETASLAWLVASFASAPSLLPAMLEAAAKVERNSPAFLTVTFHHIRLLIESGRKEDARERLEALLSSGRLTELPSARNLFLAQRLQLARNLGEFLRYAPRVPVGVVYEPEMGEIPLGPKAQKALIEATEVLNGLPLDLLQQAAVNKELPPHLRREVALAAWVRAVLFENSTIGQALASVLVTLMPELKADFNAYRLANSLEARQFAAVFLMLKLPGARPYLREGFRQLTPPNQVDGYRDNWWSCRSGGGAILDSIHFLTEEQKTATMREWKAFPSVDATFRQVLTWAQAHPNDPRVPQALHRAVRSARYGCTSGDLSRQAFRLLHKRYPGSEWAKRTKYWYSGN